MKFTYPVYLYALSAIAIPVIIHLFNFQRPKRILFTNVRFLREVIDANQSRLKLKHLLILLSRIAFVAFLVLAFAQPFLPGSNSIMQSRSGEVAVYIDNSPSLYVEQNGYKGIDLARKNYSEMASVLNKANKYRLYENSYTVSQNPLTAGRADGLVNELAVSYNNRTIEEINSRMNTAEQNPLVKVFVSDFQQNISSTSLEKLRTDTSSTILMVPLAAEKERFNMYIDSVWLSSPFVIAGNEIEINARIANISNTAAENTNVRLIINETQVGTATVAPQALGTATVKFTNLVKGQEELKAVLAISDNGFLYDNEYFFVCTPSKPVNVLEITGVNSNYLQTVYSNTEIFNYEKQQVNAVEYSKIAEKDVVILNQIQNIPEALSAELAKFVKEGGSELLIPSDKADVKQYAAHLQAQGLVMQGYTGTDTTKVSKQNIQRPDINSKYFYDVFEKMPRQMDVPFSRTILQVTGYREKILKQKDDSPYLVLKNTGGGKVYVLGSPLHDNYTNFHRHSLFVPVLYKIAQYSSAGNTDLSYSLTKPMVQVQLQTDVKNAVFQLAGKGGTMIPQQVVNNKKLTMEPGVSNLQPGFYTLTEPKLAYTKTIAFNADKKESDSKFYVAADLKEQFAGLKHIQVLDGTDTKTFAAGFKEQTTNKPLWQYCLYICLFFLLVEILLIRFL